MRVLSLSAYAAQSHRYWQHRLRAMFGDWDWTELSLPPRYFSWRIRGNPLIWSRDQRQALEQPYDLLIATSMVDLATLRGLVPALAGIPSLLYFHENQFDYPQDRQRHSLLEAQMVSLYGALAADRIAFNSAYNRDSFLAGVAALLGKLPDLVPSGVVEDLVERSQVLPVPISEPERTTPEWPGVQGNYPDRPLRLLWSARFEHDKGGEGLLQILQRLEQPFELALTGQQFRDSPPVFEDIRQRFTQQLVQFGYVEDAGRFRALQAGADLVLSTAEHEFQGLAVLEAVAAGCLPVVPDRLAYREMYPESARYTSCPGDRAAEADSAARLIGDLAMRLATCQVEPPSVSAFSQAALAHRYREILEGLAG